jgi:hypothetical protein
LNKIEILKKAGNKFWDVMRGTRVKNQKNKVNRDSAIQIEPRSFAAEFQLLFLQKLRSLPLSSLSPVKLAGLPIYLQSEIHFTA